MTKFSVLDLVPIVEGGSVGRALEEARALAQRADELGFHRYWVAEHHGMPAIASAATSVVLAHVGAATSRIRIGAGGIMLPNHSPLVIAEQFGTLEALFPGRVDLGLGRAAGADGTVARALRRDPNAAAEAFPQDVLELQAYLAGDSRTGVSAIPGAGSRVPLWILGSSTFGARLAAAFGLPYAFASHFAPGLLDEAIALYRSEFKPSSVLAEPRVMAGFNVVAAETDAEAEYLASSMVQSFVALRTTGPVPVPPPRDGYRASLPPQARQIIDHVLSCSAIGAPETVRDGLSRFVERTGVDEVIVAGMIYDAGARRRSFEILADLLPID